VTPFDTATPMYHGTAARSFDEFMGWRPVFFTTSRAYAAVYMEKGDGQPRIVEARLDVRHPFVGRSPEDVAFWNDDFVPWMRSRHPALSVSLNPIAPRDGVPFVWADEFFVHLRRTARAGTSRYDGMIVDETATAAFVKGGEITVVPLHVSQIAIHN